MLCVESMVRVILKDSIGRYIRPEVSATKFSTVGTIFGVFMDPTNNDSNFFE